jgi:uncharacterized protein (TIGR02284 family)
LVGEARKIVPVLNRLVEICLNGRRGFEEAARVVRDPRLAAVLQEYAIQREQFGARLMYEVARLGGRPEKHGTVAGLAHRRWMDVRSVMGGDDPAVLRECERGDRHARSAYERALSADLPPEIRALLQDQLAQISAAHRDLEQLQRRLCPAC